MQAAALIATILFAATPAWQWPSFARVDVRPHLDQPQLVPPAELFDELVRAYAAAPTVYPAFVRQQSDDLFRDPAEWAKFAHLVADYAALVQREEALRNERVAATEARQRRIDRELARLRALECPAAAAALRATREAFGAERVERFLATVIAPGHRLDERPATWPYDCTN